jgi:hypothetical protein
MGLDVEPDWTDSKPQHWLKDWLEDRLPVGWLGLEGQGAQEVAQLLQLLRLTVHSHRGPDTQQLLEVAQLLRLTVYSYRGPDTQ